MLLAAHQGIARVSLLLVPSHSGHHLRVLSAVVSWHPYPHRCIVARCQSSRSGVWRAIGLCFHLPYFSKRISALPMTIVLLIILLMLLGWAAPYLLLIPMTHIMLVLHGLQKANTGHMASGVLHIVAGLASLPAVLYIIFG
jgi:hypothetical protein